MSSQPDARLAGLRVLVLEDDYFLAEDTARTLRNTGAEVLGPYGDAADAVVVADQTKPGCALVDVNLGRGPNFAPARALLARGVSVLFLTGYDTDAIPEDLRGLPCLQKPVPAARLIQAVESAVRRPPR